MRHFLDRYRLIISLSISVVVSFWLFLVGAITNSSVDFWYMPYNLALALVPVPLSYWLVHLASKRGWGHGYTVGVATVWLLFLPNSFYIICDITHLYDVPRVDHLLDAAMLLSFAFNGLAFGYVSVGMIHRQLQRTMGRLIAATIVACILLVCGFAIYLGRELRWNSWDIIVRPMQLLTDTVAALFNPHALLTTVVFFALLSSGYGLLLSVVPMSKGGVRAHGK